VDSLTLSNPSEKYYVGIAEDEAAHVKLTGSWGTLVGAQDTFCKYHWLILMLYLPFYSDHILEYENYAGYDKTTKHIRSSEVGGSVCSLKKIHSHET
jgi:hypothetical protein